jgi:hypothetical protein
VAAAAVPPLLLPPPPLPLPENSGGRLSPSRSKNCPSNCEERDELLLFGSAFVRDETRWMVTRKIPVWEFGR